MKKIFGIVLFLGVLSMSTGFILTKDSSNIIGTWIRKSDHLRIEISEEEGTSRMNSFIVQEGNEDFPCDVAALPIYKNIVRVGKNLWTCDFLVVTMGSCTTDYEEGIIRIEKNGDLEITCPGFEKKIYTKSRPRKES